MSQEDMANELSRILEEMRKLDPTTEKYKTTLDNYSKLMHTLHEELESCDSDLDHALKRKIDEAMLDLKRMEAKNSTKQAKLEVWLGLIKIGLAILGMLGAIIITGSLEQSTILSQKCLSFVRMLMPKVV